MTKLTLVTILVLMVDVIPFRFASAGLTQLENREQNVRFGELNGLQQGHPDEPSIDKNATHIPPDKFITAGSPTSIAQYPWLVHLTVAVDETVGSNVRVYACGGSLISERHVVTAAHCLDFHIRNYEDVSVYLAEYNLRTFPTDCVGTQCVQNVVMHPDRIIIHDQFQLRTFRNDIGMLRLSAPAPKNDYIRPIPLPTNNINDPKYDGTPLIIAGWGQTEHGQQSSVKLHAEVHLASPHTCRSRDRPRAANTYATPLCRRYFPVTQKILCAAGTNGQDTCFGDSGGPIMMEQQGQYQLVGIISFGLGKCGSSKPSMYTNVFSYLDWINNSMKD